MKDAITLFVPLFERCFDLVLEKIDQNIGNERNWSWRDAHWLGEAALNLTHGDHTVSHAPSPAVVGLRQGGSEIIAADC